MGVEIRLQGTAIPCIAQEDIKAGLAVEIVPATNAPATLAGDPFPDPSLQGGQFAVLQGAALPTGDDDKQAHYVAAFRVYNEVPPLYETLPTLNEGTTVPYTLRGWTSGSSNLPATGITLRVVVPRLEYDATIPSGALMLAYDDGIYTVTSGCFEPDTYVIGEALSVKTGGTWYAGSTGQVGTVFEQNTTKNTLTIKTKGIA